jgi:serine/threonine protein kinase
MSEKPQFLAEGAYGCVHRPSLHCNNTIKINYKNKLSKVMSSKNAKIELKEYVLIDKIDPRAEFYLGKPETCKFEKSSINMKPLEKCNIGKKILESDKDYELLIMQDGGDNLAEFTEKMKTSSVNESNKKMMEQFWAEAKRLLYGVKAFLKYGKIHHDLKPQNIVYNSVTNRCNIIDFGIMEDINKSKKEAKQNKYGYAYYHWNFPTESDFLNVSKFDYFTKFNLTQKNKMLLKIFKDSKNQLAVFYQYTLKTRDLQNVYFTNILKTGDLQKSEHLMEWTNYLLNDMTTSTYDKFLDKCFETYDIYGLGLSLMHVLKNTNHIGSEKLYFNLKNLFNSMITPNLTKRITIDEAIEQYENILLDFQNKEANTEYKVLLKLEKSIESIVKDIKTPISNKEFIADMDPKPIAENKKIKIRIKKPKSKSKSAKKCPEGKVLNDFTNRCNKVKTQKTVKKTKSKSKSIKKCPVGKVLNTKTNRCNKVKSKSSKKCPEGKVLNDFTNRCNKLSDFIALQ